MTTIVRACAAGAVLAVVGSAFAGSTDIVPGAVTFDNRADFDAAAGSLSGFESFENEPYGFIGAGQRYTTTSGLALTVESGPFGSAANFGFSFLGSFATDGHNHVRVRARELTLDLPGEVNAIGFDITDYPELHGSRMSVTTSNGDTFDVNFTGFGNGNFQFFGLVNLETTFTSVTIHNSRQNLDPYGLDAISFGAINMPPHIIPMPAPAMLASAGMLAVAARRRRH